MEQLTKLQRGGSSLISGTRPFRRLLGVGLLALAIATILIGTLADDWSRVEHLSTQICLSCMGLV